MGTSMTIDLTKFSESLLEETQDCKFKREIDENSSEIARALKEAGVYENPKSGLRISLSRR